MSDLVFNDTTNFSYSYSAEMKPITTPQASPLGIVQQVVEHSSHDWMIYSINVSQMIPADQKTVLDFVRARFGDADDFLFKDEFGYGYEVARQTIGTGDGAENEFQMIETVGGRDFERWDIVAASYTLWVNDVAQVEGAGNDYTIDITKSGLVTFTAGSIPALGHLVEALFEYYTK